ncbi:MAG: hypothetical protein ACREL7_07595, partial [Longimicrobiales bacterium]
MAGSLQPESAMMQKESDRVQFKPSTYHRHRTSGGRHAQHDGRHRVAGCDVVNTAIRKVIM